MLKVWLVVGAVHALAAGSCAAAQVKPEDSEVWSPTPPVVSPAATVGGAPDDAIVLFDGSGLEQWVSVTDGSAAGWTVSCGVMTVEDSRGNIQTRRDFEDYQLHLEWRVPADVTGRGQGRGNAGVFLASTGPGDRGYEIQILDSYRNPTYVNGQAASLYKQHPPLANASREPGAWQTYDVVWRAPRFDANQALRTPATVTLLHNGVLVQDHAIVAGETVYIGTPRYAAHGPSPIKLQAHGAAVSFRNIWVRPLPPLP